MSYIGANKIGGMHLGSTTIAKAYLGSDLVYQKGGVVPPSPLPYDSKVEYLRNPASTNCWINTNIVGNVRIVGKAQELILRNASSVLMGSLGAATGGTWFGEAGNSKKWGLGTGTGANVNIVPTTLVEFDIEFDGSGARGTVENLSLYRNANTNHGNWYIFSSGNTNYPFRGDVYYIKIYQNNVLVRDYIPVRVGQVGYLYDKVSGTLFGNANTGAFEFGNDIT